MPRIVRCAGIACLLNFNRKSEMATEENQMTKQLLATGASVAQQTQALSWLADYCEESYILNLPPSTAAMSALDKFSKKTKGDAALKRRAAKLYKQYKLR
jgi:hypothetical protein